MKQDTGLFFIRLGLGLLFLLTGFGKLTGILGPGLSGFAQVVWGSMILSVLVAVGEFFGALSLLTGIWTKYSTIWLSVIMVGAIFIVSIPGFDASNPMTLVGLLLNLNVLTALIGITLTGPGAHSIGRSSF